MACLDLRSLGQSLIASICMQADSLLLVIKTATAAQAIFRMPDQCASLEPQAAGSHHRAYVLPLLRLASDAVDDDASAPERHTTDTCRSVSLPHS